MEFNEVVDKRYSVRKFKSDKIENEKLDKILSIIKKVPTAKNKQPTKVYVIKSEEGLKKIDDVTPCRYNAPVVLAFGCDINKSWVNGFSNENEYKIDATITATMLMLEATNLNLGSCYVCYFDANKINEALDIDKNIKIVSLLPIGYIDDECKPSENHTIRKELKEMVEER